MKKYKKDILAIKNFFLTWFLYRSERKAINSEPDS